MLKQHRFSTRALRLSQLQQNARVENPCYLGGEMLPLLADTTPAFDQLTNLGVAGLMGAMWLWERRTSRQREDQIDEAHARIMSDRVLLDELMDVVRQNTEAITRLTELSTKKEKPS
jgi:hypothetical protein